MWFFRSNKKRNAEPEGDGPAFWKDYLRLFRTPLPAQTPIHEVPFVVFDTETTGVDPAKDRILSIGAVRVCNWQIDISGSLECIIARHDSNTSPAVVIHGILPKERPNDLEEREALEKFVRMIGNSILVGHHVGFDIAVINQALKPLTGSGLKNKRVDTGALSKRVNPVSGQVYPAGPLSLDDLCKQYRIRPSDRHTAAGDAFITATLLLKLLSRLRNRGVQHLGDLLRSR